MAIERSEVLALVDGLKASIEALPEVAVGDQIAQLQAQIDTLTTQVAGLTAQVDALQGKINGAISLLQG